MSEMLAFNGALIRQGQGTEQRLDEAKLMQALNGFDYSFDLTAFEISVLQGTHITINPTDRSVWFGLYSSGNGDGPDHTIVGAGSFDDDCPVWPLGKNATPLSEQDLSNIEEIVSALRTVLVEDFDTSVGSVSIGFFIQNCG